jgi:hemerythrin-like domain-containing protein
MRKPSVPAPSDGFEALDEAHRQMLAAASGLELLVATIDDHDPTAAQRAQARGFAELFATTVRQHHEDEERHVFPALLQSDDPQVVRAVLSLQQDHGWLEEDWLELEPHLQALATGFGTCDFDVLGPGSTVFVALLRAHIALEEALIYPQARSRLNEDSRHAMAREMAARRRGRPATRQEP